MARDRKAPTRKKRKAHILKRKDPKSGDRNAITPEQRRRWKRQARKNRRI